MGTATPLVDLETIAFVGQDLYRPECVVCDARGVLHVSDWRGGVTIIAPDGRQTSILATDLGLRPNGVWLAPDGSYLIAHLGADTGGVFRLAPDGSCRPILSSLHGEPLPPSNYALRDGQGRIWLTVSTRHRPRAQAYRADVADGFIVMIDAAGARIAADGLAYPNECRCSTDGRFLYVNETFGRRLSRFVIGDDGSLDDRRTISTFGPGTFPDGLAALGDDDWLVTSIVSNRVLHVDRNGEQTLVVEDADPAHVDWVEDAFQAGTMGRPHLDSAAGRRLANISSLAVGGRDRRSAYLGCLLGKAIATFQLPAALSPNGAI